jgi:hypothetical protein
MKLLLANGCSHTAGSDIDSNNLSRCVESAWPRWVADHYGIKFLNIAEPGSGNEQISRSTIMMVSNLIEFEKILPEDLSVCIAWSGFDRYEYWSDKHDQFKSYTINMVSDAKRKYNPGDDVRKYIEYRTLIETSDYSQYKNLYYIYTTAKILDSYNLKYYFSNTYQTFQYPQQLKQSENLTNIYVNMLNLYGNRLENHLGFFDAEKTLKNILKNIPNSPYGFGHWGEDGQKEYAKHFIKHMEEVDGRMGN